LRPHGVAAHNCSASSSASRAAFSAEARFHATAASSSVGRRRKTMSAKCASRIHLCAFGRGTPEAETELRQLFSSTGIQLSVLGLLPAEQIGDILANSDVQVDVRASLSSRRGSAIAGIVCGTPVIGFESPETDNAIREAGVVLFPPGDMKELAAAITRILSDDSFREELRQRNRIATEKYFSWKAISGRLLNSLQGVNTAI